MIVNMFYVPLILIQCEEWHKKKKKIEEIYKKQKKYIDHFGNDDCKTDYFDVKENSKLAWNDQIDDIFFEELSIVKKQLDLDLHVTLSWFEVSDYGDCHNAHTHGNSGYSAVCYVDYNSEFHKPTIFLSPFKNFIDGSDLEYAPSNIEEGSLLFFPSSILHYTRPNRSKIPRKILSFNLKCSERA